MPDLVESYIRSCGTGLGLVAWGSQMYHAYRLGIGEYCEAKKAEFELKPQTNVQALRKTVIHALTDLAVAPVMFSAAEFFGTDCLGRFLYACDQIVETICDHCPGAN